MRAVTAAATRCKTISSGRRFSVQRHRNVLSPRLRDSARTPPLASGTSCGSSLPSRSAWQPVQESEAWTEAENFFRIHIERNRPVSPLDREAFLAVAGKARIVLIRPGPGSKQQHARKTTEAQSRRTRRPPECASRTFPLRPLPPVRGAIAFHASPTFYLRGASITSSSVPDSSS